MPEYFIAGSAIFCISALLQGLTGFGFSILAVPLITLFISPQTTVPIMLLYSIVINIVVLTSAHRALNLRAIGLLLVFGIIGMPIGTRLLIVLPDVWIRLGIGVLIIGFAALQLAGFRARIKHEKLITAPVGLVSGILSGSVSMSGPPIILFLTNQEVDRQSFRGNLAGYFFLLNLVTLPVYWASGLFTRQVITYTAWYAPALIVGVISGNLLSHRIKDHHFRRIILVILIAMGILALASAARSLGAST